MHTPDLTPDEITDLVMNTAGNVRAEWARLFINFMSGYLHYASDIEATRQTFFKELKKELERDV